jgi:hypothetical protein
MSFLVNGIRELPSIYPGNNMHKMYCSGMTISFKQINESFRVLSYYSSSFSQIRLIGTIAHKTDKSDAIYLFVFIISSPCIT